MKGFRMNVYKAGIAGAALVSILGICAFCYGNGEKAENEENVTYVDWVDASDKAGGDKGEQYRIFLKSQLESTVESTEAISGCHIDFEVTDDVIVKADVVLEIAESFEGEKEELMESIKKAVATTTALSAEDVSVSEKPTPDV